MSFFENAINCIINGLMALSLSLIMWRLTGSYDGWLILFLPGVAFIVYGWYRLLKN